VSWERFWANWLLWFLFLVSIGLGSLFIVALEHLVGAKWSVPIRRTAERLGGLVLLAVPLAADLLLERRGQREIPRRLFRSFSGRLAAR